MPANTHACRACRAHCALLHPGAARPRSGIAEALESFDRLPCRAVPCRAVPCRAVPSRRRHSPVGAGHAREQPPLQRISRAWRAPTHRNGEVPERDCRDARIVRSFVVSMQAFPRRSGPCPRTPTPAAHVARMARSYTQEQRGPGTGLPKRSNCSGEKFVRASRERGAVCGAPICPGSPGAIPDMSVGAVQGCTQRR